MLREEIKRLEDEVLEVDLDDVKVMLAKCIEFQIYNENKCGRGSKLRERHAQLLKEEGKRGDVMMLREVGLLAIDCMLELISEPRFKELVSLIKISI